MVKSHILLISHITICFFTESFKLIKMLSQEKIRVSVFKGSFNYLQHIFPPNSIVFLLNLNCENATFILREVNVATKTKRRYIFIIFSAMN